jgi:hypothetical protein
VSKELNISYNKVLKLTNVLIRNIKEDEFDKIDQIAHMMESYIKSKAAQLIGPLIQYTKGVVGEDGQPQVELNLLYQANNYIHEVEAPYIIQSVIRITGCMYVRFIGEESKIKFAYDKIGVVAYEEDIELKGDSYTVFVKNNDGQLTADIFMEKKHE